MSPGVGYAFGERHTQKAHVNLPVRTANATQTTQKSQRLVPYHGKYKHQMYDL